MSPEQISGKHVDGRSDLYSLGVMLFQLLTGYLPFRGDSMAELMFKIANEPAPDIRSIRPDISAALAQVVAKALIKQERVREENGIAIQEPVRYQNGTQMAQELRESMGMVTTSPSPMPTPMSEVSAAGTSVVSKPVSSSNVVASTTQTNQAVHVEPLEPTVFEKYETTVVNHPHVQVESSSTDTPSTPSVTSDSTSQHYMRGSTAWNLIYL
jgi:serine/threonine-protein kinase